MAFGIMLSPGLLQTGELTCETSGDTQLLSLSLEVDGREQIAFDGAVRNYEVNVISDLGAAALSAASSDPAAKVTYNLRAPDGFIGGGILGIGGGQANLNIPFGSTTLRVSVKVPEGALDHYELNLQRSATAIAIESPMPDERFISGETLRFDARVVGEGNQEATDLVWTSSLDGPLGSGASLTAGPLTVGDHDITVVGYGAAATTRVRVFSDLGTFYEAAPAWGEIERIRNDFTINQISGTGIDEDWFPYQSLAFDQSSTDPTELVVIARLDVLRHQRFAEPLPFTNGATLYEHLRAHVHALNLSLECRLNLGGGGTILFSRTMSVWDRRYQPTDDPEACKEPLPDTPLQEYLAPLSLIMHEARHSEPDDPGHVNCNGRPRDTTLEGGSGYAQSVLYYMWIYRYSLYDPPDFRERSGSQARLMLPVFFCETPTHSNPLVQAILDELLN